MFEVIRYDSDGSANNVWLCRRSMSTRPARSDPYKVHRESCRGDLSGRPRITVFRR